MDRLQIMHLGSIDSQGFLAPKARKSQYSLHRDKSAIKTKVKNCDKSTQIETKMHILEIFQCIDYLLTDKNLARLRLAKFLIIFQIIHLQITISAKF